MTDSGDVIRVEDHDRVRVITFDRPEVLNAFDTSLYVAVGGALDAARADDTVHAVVLAGAGRAFSSGQDLDEMVAIAEAARRDDGTAASGFPVLLDALQAFDKPLLAAVHGAALGIGFTLLAHCDMVVVGEGARLKVPFAPMGVGAEAASSYLFPMRMGWQRAAYVLLTGEWVSGLQAVEWGMALEAKPDDEVLARALELATQVSVASLDSLRAIKGAMRVGQAEAVVAARAHEEAVFARLIESFGAA